MAKIAGTSQKIYRELFECPACHRKVDASVEVQMEFGAADAEGKITGTGKVTGLSVSHNCINQQIRDRTVTRSGGQLTTEKGSPTYNPDSV